MKIFRLFVLTAILLTIGSFGFSQVGINTISPDSSASLHILSKPSGSGLLIPKLTEAQRLNIFKPAIGLMVFDLSANLFYMNMDTVAGDNWYAINPWLTKGNSSTANVMYTSSVVTKVGIGTPTPSAKLDVVGNINASTSVNTDTVNANRLKVAGFPLNSLVPAGAIMMWSGTTAPSGWALCDGAGGRPDLRGRFVVGFDSGGGLTPLAAPADGTTTNYGAVSNTGGEIGHTLTSSESGLPGHDHTSNPHSHGYSNLTSQNASNSGTGQETWSAMVYGTSTQAVTVVINAVVAQDASQVHENRPPYYVLAYIIKLP